MTYTIDLTDELAERAKRAATRRRLTVKRFLKEVVTQALHAEPAPESGAELVEYWERKGVIGMWAKRTDITDSVGYARRLRRQAEQRRR